MAGTGPAMTTANSNSSFPGTNVANGAVTCKHRLPTRRLRTKARPVRCGRETHEQAVYRDRDAELRSSEWFDNPHNPE